MSGPLRLTDREDRHLGFVLLAGKGYPLDADTFEGHCVFMPLPQEPSLFEGDAYLALAKYRDAGEHQYSMKRMGSQRVFTITGSDTDQIEIAVASDQPGSWAVTHGGLKRPMGRAHLVENP